MAVITILGAGAMGSALATPLTQAGWETRLWGTWLDEHLIDACEAGKPHPRTNVPLAPGPHSAAFRRACTETLLPAIEAFAPQLLLVSAGFDAHRLDPLANLGLEDDDYAWLSAALVAIAERHAGGRLVSTLEGGYSLTALRHAATVHCRALFGTTAP